MNVLARDPGLTLADHWQRDFPLSAQPYAYVGRAHALSEGEVIATLQGLIDRGLMSRIGAVVRPNAAGASTLAAIAVPVEHLDEIAALVSSERCVNHNYERGHPINLWFVVAAPDAAELEDTLQRIETRTGCHVHDLRLERPFHIDLGFSLTGERAKCVGDGSFVRPADIRERQLLAALEDGLALVPRPYDELARRLGWSADAVSGMVADMIEAGIISRFGCVLRHRALGFTANAMAVWDVGDDTVDAVGELMATLPHVTLCYRRKRDLPAWRYNLFAMVHGCDEALVRRRVIDIAAAAGLDHAPHAVLFSLRCFKQRGARFSAAAERRSA